MANVAASRSRVCAAFGSWEMDKEKVDLVPNITLQCSTRLSLLIYNDAYFVKILENGHNGDEQLEPERVLGLEKEIQLMILAGDCSIQPIGRVHNHPGSLCGVIMHLGAGIGHTEDHWRCSQLLHPSMHDSFRGNSQASRHVVIYLGFGVSEMVLSSRLYLSSDDTLGVGIEWQPKSVQ